MKQQSPDSVGNELISEIQKLGQSQGLNTVFSTFLEISAVCLDAQFNPEHREQQKARYAAMTANMTPEELSVYAKMLALLYLEIRKCRDEPRDILGSVYHSLNLNNEWNGQFFTPDYLCRMMAELTGFVSEEDLKKKGYATIQDPACGSGAIFLAYVYARKQRGMDFQTTHLFVGRDNDIRCVWMAYIQLCLYEIPAVVIHGDSITMEEWSTWQTPYAHLPILAAQERKRQKSEVVPA